MLRFSARFRGREDFEAEHRLLLARTESRLRPPRMLDAHFHALGRQRPGRGLEVNLGPQGTARLTATHRGEDQELKSQSIRLPSIAGALRGERGSDLRMR